MAVLGATSLTGCNSIPSFIATGSKMIFKNATVPVSWTKDTTPNQAMLRITNSSVTTGGSLTFSQVFQASKPLSGNSGPSPISSYSFNPATAGSVTFVGQSAFSGPIQVDNATLAEAQIVAHTHTANFATQPSISISVGPSAALGNNPSPATTANSAIFGDGAAQHTHTMSGVHNHANVPSASGHAHPVGSSDTSHTHPISGGTENFNITYVDVVIASKD